MLIQDLENLLLDDPASSTLPPTSVPPALLEPSTTTEESTVIIADGVKKVFKEEEVNLMTQRHIDKFQLVDILNNYHRYCYTTRALVCQHFFLTNEYEYLTFWANEYE